MFKTHLLGLLQLCDPSLPIGSYAHSSGLETYVQKGIVKDKETALEFVTEMLIQNIQYTDAAFVSLAYDAAQQNNWDKIQQLDNECSAVKLPREIRQASQKLGTRLVKIFSPFCSSIIAGKFQEAIYNRIITGHYCIAFGIYAAGLFIPKDEALAGFYYNTAAGIVTNSVKLIPLSQHDGQEILFSLHALINELVQNSLNPDTELIGVCCTGFDMRCMQHEQLYSRLYMS